MAKPVSGSIHTQHQPPGVGPLYIICEAFVRNRELFMVCVGFTMFPMRERRHTNVPRLCAKSYIQTLNIMFVHVGFA